MRLKVERCSIPTLIKRINVDGLFTMMVYNNLFRHCSAFSDSSGSNLSTKWSRILRTVTCSWWRFWTKPCAEDRFLIVSLLLGLNCFLFNQSHTHHYSLKFTFTNLCLYTVKFVLNCTSSWNSIPWLEFVSKGSD